MGELCIVSIYNPGHQVILAADWEEILEQLPSPFMLLGDFNSHHTLWGSVQSDRAGRELSEALDTRACVVLNDRTHTRIPRPGQQLSYLDLAIVDNRCARSATWRVIQEPFGSDHYPILLTYSPITPARREPPRTTAVHSFNCKKADWPEFSRLCETEHGRLPAGLDHTRYSDFTNGVLSAAESSIPRKRVVPHLGSPPVSLVG